MGPLEALNTLSRNTSKNDFTLNIITPGGLPSSTAPADGPGSQVNQQLVATHGYSYDPNNKHADLLKNIPPADVLIVPGGIGPPAWEHPGTVEFLRQYYNKYLKGHSDRYLFTVCTGSNLAAQAGCLDGTYATTNKVAFNWIMGFPTSQNTYWVAKSRWVDSGNIWTTSGVSAGTDGMLAWMKKIYGQDPDGVYFSKKVADGMEWIAAEDHLNDPFAGDLVDHPGKSGLPAPAWEKS